MEPEILDRTGGESEDKRAQQNAARNGGCERKGKKYGPTQRGEAERRESKELPDSRTQNDARSHDDENSSLEKPPQQLKGGETWE